MHYPSKQRFFSVVFVVDVVVVVVVVVVVGAPSAHRSPPPGDVFLPPVEAGYRPMEEGDEVELDFDEDDFEEADDLFDAEGPGDDPEDDEEHDLSR